MNSAFRLKETLYLEISPEKNFPVIPAGRTIPAIWQQTFTTYFENQRSFDLHLLRGHSDQLAENITLGKWRIGGIPPGDKGKHRITVETRVGADGSVAVRATLDEQSLPVTLLTEPFPKIPLTFRVPTIPLDKKVQTTCPECKHRFVIRSTNWKGDSYALCLDCGHEFELPDTASVGVSAPWEDLPPELVRTLGIETPHKPGGLDTGALRELQEKGYDWSIHDDPDLSISVDKIAQQIPKMIARSPKSANDLSVDDIIRMAGDPLPEDQRRNCPKCDAVIALEATRCEWCGQTF